MGNQNEPATEAKCIPIPVASIDVSFDSLFRKFDKQRSPLDHRDYKLEYHLAPKEEGSPFEHICTLLKQLFDPTELVACELSIFDPKDHSQEVFYSRIATINEQMFKDYLEEMEANTQARNETPQGHRYFGVRATALFARYGGPGGGGAKCQ